MLWALVVKLISYVISHLQRKTIYINVISNLMQTHDQMDD